MNALLWVLQVLLALVFLAHGWLLLRPPADLIEQMNAMMSTGFRFFLGIAEVLTAAGLTLPGLSRPPSEPLGHRSLSGRVVLNF